MAAAPHVLAADSPAEQASPPLAHPLYIVEHSLVSDIAVCVIAAWVVAAASHAVRQPLLLAYLLAGFAIGPHGLRWVTDAASIQLISEIGLSLLLFMIGLEIDLKRMVSAGKMITTTALVQILGCVALGWLFFERNGLASGWLEALYLAVALALSSTVIVVKGLYDKRELDTLAGRITLGVLVLQDLFVVVFLALQPDLKHPELQVFATAAGKVFLLCGVAYLASRFVLPPVFRSVALQPELVLVGALAWCFALAGFAQFLGLSPEMGALIAGVMVSTFPYTLDVIAKVTSLRDFFVTLFFVGLGMTVPLPTWDVASWALLVSAFVVLSRLVTVFPVLHFLRLGHRVSLLPALNLCQISELSLVLLTLGKAAGDVSDHAINVVALAFAFLAVDSTYIIAKGGAILRRLSPLLAWLGFRDLPAVVETDGGREHDAARIYLLGFSWTASSLLEEIRARKPELLPAVQVVDYNPVVIERLRQRGVRVVYGDVSQRDTLVHAGLSRAEIIICSLPDMVLRGANNLKLVRQLRELNPSAQIVVHAEKLADVSALYAAGASYVSAPRLLEANDLLEAIDAASANSLDLRSADQLERVRRRDEVIP